MNIRGEEMYVNIVGHGEPIVFLHGGPGDEHRYFLPHVLPLADHFSLVFYDQRGCGQSERSLEPTSYTLQAEIEALEGLREVLQLERINILGQSWGTMLALQYATTYPERVHKLQLVSAIGASFEGYRYFIRELLEHRMEMTDQLGLKLLETQIQSGAITVEQSVELGKKIMYPYYVRHLESLQRLTPTQVNRDVHRAMYDDIQRRYDVTDNLDKLQDIPVHIVQGLHDLITPQALEQLLTAYVPHVRMTVMAESGHWPFLEEAERFNRVTKDFFND